jgi:hypothetical protein
VKGLPRGLTFADFRSAKLDGQMKDLPQHLTTAFFLHSKEIEGHLSEIPNQLTCYRKSDADGGGFYCV